jgi:hypothetical protein
MTTQTTPTATLLEGEQRRRPSRLLVIALLVAGVIAIGGLAFAAGRMTAPPAAAAFPSAGGNFNGGPGNFQPPGGQNGQGFPGGGFGGGGPSLDGTVTAMDGDSITLQTANGSTLTVNLSGDTSYAQEEPASADDLDEGDSVRVQVDFGALQGQNTNEVDASSVTLTQP